MPKKIIYAEDAVKVLTKIEKQYAVGDLRDKLVEWAKLAIMILPSAQPQACDDAISREDAKWVVFCNRDHVEDQTNAIDSLPCVQSFVQPQRIKGKWKRKESDLSWWYECSECGESPLFDPYEHEVRTPFCPWCGADMRKGEEDADY